MPVVLIFLTLFFPLLSWSYPEFIGYKYTTCLTCHFNGQGNGPLNDYGRALWSSEIAGRWLAGQKSDEELGESSGFLGKKEIPYWLRPGVKARQLTIVSNPGGSATDTRSITMQADFNLATFFDRDQKLGFIFSIGYLPPPLVSSPTTETKTWISREHYFRWQATDNLWVYLGAMDKVYGIRHVNHTAYSRVTVGLGQNDQSHGLVVHYIQPKWEFTLNAFAGDLIDEQPDARQQGGSVMYEYEVQPNWRIGTSLLSSSSKTQLNQRLALHSRTGLGYGSALLFELGIIDNTPISTGTSTKGYYVFSEAIQRLVRGYHLFVVGQANKTNFEVSGTDSLRAGVGVLMFPMARTELRIELENRRSITSTPDVPADFWALISQIHLSF